jgi:hypothetical protein
MNDAPEFTEALRAVLRDLRAQCPVQPEVHHVHEGEVGPGALLYAPDGSGQALYAEPDGRPGMLLADVADQLQTWAVEALWTARVPAVWPHCPEHPDTHPLTATAVKGTAVWVCPRSGTAVAAVGELPERRVA